jgi:predicted metal-dependent phosphotriesterase family hydrolase
MGLFAGTEERVCPLAVTSRSLPGAFGAKQGMALFSIKPIRISIIHGDMQSSHAESEQKMKARGVHTEF